MKNNQVMLLAALSDIGVAIARAYAAAGRPLLLLARDGEALAREAEHLRLRYDVAVETRVYDVLDNAEAWLSRLQPFPRTVISAVGLLGDHEQNVAERGAADLVFRTNFTAPALFLQACANRMLADGTTGATIIGISSIAGDRGRAKNYIYGAAKAGFSAFLSGLRARMAAQNVRVISVKPGFVRTRMLAGMKTPALLTAEPAEVADAILKAEARRRDVIYVRAVWRPIMALIRALPEGIFKKTKF